MSFIPTFEIGVWNGLIFIVWLLIQTLAIRLVSKEVYQRAGYPPDMKLSYANRIGTTTGGRSMQRRYSVYSV